MNKEIIHKIDLILLIAGIISLVTIVGIVGFRTPYVILPQDNLTTSEETVLFSFENADKVLIDDNQNFSSPKVWEVKDNLIIELEPGIYYWKLQGIVESKIRKLNIQSKIDLRMNKLNNSYTLTNAGNIGLNVEVYNKSELKRNFSLGTNEKEKVLGNKFIGSQK
jgi:hypothetical protein